MGESTDWSSSKFSRLQTLLELDIVAVGMSWRQALSKNLKEVRLHLCQTSKSSQGVREFIEKHYVELKQQNPKFPFLVRECSGVEPKVYARYDYGQERSLSLANKNSQQVLESLETLVQAGGK